MSSRSRWVHLWWIIPLVGSLAGVYVYVTQAQSAIAVRLVNVERASLVSTLTTNGKVEPMDPRELRALVPGTVTNVMVKEGDRITGGKPLVQMDRTEALAEVARADAALQAAEGDSQLIAKGGTTVENLELENLIQKAALEQQEAVRELGKSERLLAKNAATRSEVDAAKDRVNKANQDLAYLQSRRGKRYSAEDRQRAEGRITEARAALQLARERLGASVAASPVSGVVYALPVQRGNFVNRGDLLAKVADLDHLRVKVYVDEPELGRLAPGQDVVLTWDAAPGVTWPGKVQRLPAAVEVLGTRSVGAVECAIENKEHRLVPGVNVNVEIVVAQRSSPTLTLPKEAVVSEVGVAGSVAKHFVFVYSDGQVHRLEVKPGIADATRVEILQGLTEGQTVAVGGETKLHDGMKVKSDASGT
jgi:HlyD family secretion protein